MPINFICLFDHLIYLYVLKIILKVAEMKAEYFPPKEDVILQNEAPTDMYILITGAVVSTRLPYLGHLLLVSWA